MQNHLVSVIIPAYNASAFIKETIESVLNQTWQNFEIIVVDDGSADDTIEVIKSVASDKIRVLAQTNKGAAAARQLGLDNAKGDFIQFLDADDLLGKEKFEVQIKALDNNPDFIAVCKTAHFFETSENLKDSIPDNDAFFQENLNDPVKFLIKLYGGFDFNGGMIQPNAYLVPRTIIEKAGPWNTELKPFPDDDGEYFCRVILNAKGLVYQTKVYNYYRKFKSAQSLSGIKSDLALINIAKGLLLKHQQLKKKNTDESLNPFIDGFLYRHLFLLLVQAYPQKKEAYSFIQHNLKKLPVPKQKLILHIGSSWINKIANINWKLARNLQILKAKI